MREFIKEYMRLYLTIVCINGVASLFVIYLVLTNGSTLSLSGWLMVGILTFIMPLFVVVLEILLGPKIPNEYEEKPKNDRDGVGLDEEPIEIPYYFEDLTPYEIIDDENP